MNVSKEAPITPKTFLSRRFSQTLLKQSRKRYLLRGSGVVQRKKYDSTRYRQKWKGEGVEPPEGRKQVADRGWLVVPTERTLELYPRAVERPWPSKMSPSP
jgi:hypothetical protein